MWWAVEPGMPPAFNAKRIPGFLTAAQKERPADPNDLRACVEAAINVEIEPEAWKRGLAVEAVIGEPVSARLFPVPREDTGKFADLGFEMTEAPRPSGKTRSFANGIP